MQFLGKLDGFEPRKEIKILGATNRPDMLDEAILRPGRFDRLIEFPIPEKDERKAIFKIHTRDMELDENIDFDRLVRKTEGVTGADIKAICSEAGMQAIRKEQEKVREKDFDKAIVKVSSGETGKISGKMFG